MRACDRCGRTYRASVAASHGHCSDRCVREARVQDEQVTRFRAEREAALIAQLRAEGASFYVDPRLGRPNPRREKAVPRKDAATSDRTRAILDEVAALLDAPSSAIAPVPYDDPDLLDLLDLLA